MKNTDRHSKFSDLFSNSKATRNIFDEIDEKADDLKKSGRTIYDCGVLDPAKAVGMPSFIYEGIEDYISENSKTGYPGNKGEEWFRVSAANYLERNFAIKLDHNSEINITNGSKTDEFIFPRAVCNRDDIVICPTPGYPAFKQGALFSHAVPFFVPLLEENGYLIDFKNHAHIPDEIAKKAKLIWVNYPNSPTGRTAPREWLEELVDWADYYNIVIASDEAYIDYRYSDPCVEDNQKNTSILNITKKNVIAFFSLSKRSNLSDFRIGFAAGDSDLINALYKIKNIHDDGVSKFIQKMAEKALNDDSHVKKMSENYNLCRKVWSEAFYNLNQEHERSGLSLNQSGGLFLWQKAPRNMTGDEFASILLEKSGIITIPGSAFDSSCDKFIRIALSPDVEFSQQVAKKIS